MAESDFLSLMPHSVVRHAASTALTQYGKVQFSTSASTFRALVTYEQKLVRAMDGTEKISTANAILNCTSAVNAQDKYTLPDGTSPLVLSITRYSDNVGQHNVRVYFG